MGRISKYYFFLVLCTLPIYLIPSGMPQMFHLFFTVGFLIYVLKSLGGSKFKLKFEDLDVLFCLFLFYVFLHSVINVGLESNLRYLLGFLYFLFSFIVFWFFRYFFSRVSRKFLVFLAIALSIIGVLSIFYSGFGFYASSYEGRSIGFFNNPNQLGFFSVILFSLSLFLYLQEFVDALLFSLIGMASVVLAAASLSKAAFLSIALGFVFFVVQRFKVSGLILLCLVASIFLFFSANLNELMIADRIANIASESDSSLASRGYFVLFQFPEMLLFGLGEPRVISILGHEVHSVFASVLTNYGVMGFLLFFSGMLMYLKKLVRKFGVFQSLTLVVPIFLYGITHNGLRFSFLWVFLSLVISVTDKNSMMSLNDRVT